MVAMHDIRSLYMIQWSTYMVQRSLYTIHWSLYIIQLVAINDTKAVITSGAIGNRGPRPESLGAVHMKRLTCCARYSSDVSNDCTR